MRKAISLFLILFCIFLLSNCEKEEEDITTVATETWESETEDSNGSGNWTIELKSDNSITISGTWNFIYSGATVSCPFSEGNLTVLADSMAFTVAGTANNPSAPSGYQNSPFELKVAGKTHTGSFTGKFEITFSETGWPSKITGTTTAVRTEGNGITS